MTISTSKTETKRLSIELRKKGYSYSEIQEFVQVPKSTLGYWLKNLKLTPLQLERVRQKRILGSRRGGEKKNQQTSNAIEKIRSSSAKNISKISKRELWLMGIMLYWRERMRHQHEDDLRKGVRFTSSDPFLIEFFLEWLIKIGKLKKEELQFDVFIREEQKEEIRHIKTYWANITKTHKDAFTRFYVQKAYKKSGSRKIKNTARLGLLRVRVKASSMLARQISGWIKGIRERI